jgi:maltose O-acetyltransferase
MDLASKIFIKAVWVLSEIEASFAKPNDRLPLRRSYLRLMQVKYGSALWIGKGFHLLSPGKLSLGERCALGENIRIENHAPIKIGDDFIAATGFHINSGTHDPTTMEPELLPITVGKRVWCGIDVAILAGVSVGDDVVLAAGSVVTKSIPSNSIAAGVPAAVVKPLSRDPNLPLWTWSTNKDRKLYL